MDVEQPRGSQRIRARMEGRFDPLAPHPVFRIENATGQVLRRIRDARNPQEAVALYWRTVSVSMPGAMMSKDLERRISRARASVGHDAMQTPELPFEAADEPEAVPDEAEAPRPVRHARAKRAAARLPQTDLFAADSADEATEAAPEEPEAEAEPEAGAETEAPVETQAVEPASSPSAPSPSAPSPPAPRLAKPSPEPRVIEAQEVMLQRVDPRNLRPTDRSDSYLYHVTNGPDAETTLRQGLLVSASDPMILTERQGVSYWLSVLADDYDYIMDGPADFVVLRLRRMAVEELLEPDPHASRSAGCPCFLLTGGAASREQHRAAAHDD